MKNLVKVVGALGLLGGFAGCGGDDKPPTIGDGPTQNKGGTRGQGGAQARGGSGGTGQLAYGAPAVRVTSPAAVSDPVDEEVLIGPQIEVVCQASQSEDEGASEVDPSSVKLAVLDAEGEPAVGVDMQPLEKPGVPTGSPDEYAASFTLTGVASGVVFFRCIASSLDASGEGSDTIGTFLDHGPTITAKLPAIDSTHKLNGVMAVEFSVAPTPLIEGDEEAAVTSMSLHVAGVEITKVTEDAQNPGTYRASVDFMDETLFEEPPTEHTSVRIEANNGRTPTPATGVLDYPIIVDGRGPVIEYTSPKDNDVIHGETTVVFKVEDAGAGVDEDSIELTLTGLADPVPYDPDDTSRWSRDGASFSFRFETANLVDVQAQVTVSVRAKDNADNATAPRSLILYVDDLPPIIDLDPGNARGKDAQDICSASFDPLGAALNDNAKTGVRFNLIRALIRDDTNKGSGLPVLHMAGTDQKSARLYLQPDPTKPFLVDTNNDGVCDDLASANLPVQTLNSISKVGALSYSKDDAGTAPSVGGICTLQDPNSMPMQLCENVSDLSVVVQHDISTKGDEPVVYAVGALNAGFECTGSTWDLGLVVENDGWVCLAARAADNLGNVGISRPLRICFDDPTVLGTPTCVDGLNVPPCTTNCTPPPRFPAHIYRF